MRIRRGTLIAALLIASALVGGYFYVRASGTGIDVRAVVACNSVPDSIGCARPIIVRLIARYRAADIVHAFAANLPQSQCHFYSHIVGEQVYLKYRSVERALAECDQTCGVACVHGAIGQAFETDAGLSSETVDPEHLSTTDILSIGAPLCRSSNTCHGVGHVLFQNTRSFTLALADCKKIARGRALSGCYTGAFMEYSAELKGQSVWDASAPVSLPSISSLDTFCDPYTDPEQIRSCYWYLPFVLSNAYAAHGDPHIPRDVMSHLFTICTAKPATIRRACMFGIGALEFQYVTENPGGAERVCERYPQAADIASCVYGASALSSNFARPQTLHAFCAAAKDLTIRTLCYQAIFAELQTTPELATSAEEFRRLCSWSDPACIVGYSQRHEASWEAINEAFPL